MTLHRNWWVFYLQSNIQYQPQKNENKTSCISCCCTKIHVCSCHNGLYKLALDCFASCTNWRTYQNYYKISKHLPVSGGWSVPRSNAFRPKIVSSSTAFLFTEDWRMAEWHIACSSLIIHNYSSYSTRKPCNWRQNPLPPPLNPIQSSLCLSLSLSLSLCNCMHIFYVHNDEINLRSLDVVTSPGVPQLSLAQNDQPQSGQAPHGWDISLLRWPRSPSSWPVFM